MVDDFLYYRQVIDFETGSNALSCPINYARSVDVEGCDTPGRFATDVAVISTEQVLFSK